MAHNNGPPRARSVADVTTNEGQQSKEGLPEHAPRLDRMKLVLPAGLALAGEAFTFTSLYLASGSLMPLLVLYEEQWEFAAALLTLMFAVYAIGFLAALLTLGRSRTISADAQFSSEH
jgi:hypothetical protein